MTSGKKITLIVLAFLTFSGLVFTGIFLVHKSLLSQEDYDIDPQEYDEKVTVNIVSFKSNIWIVDAESKHLIYDLDETREDDRQEIELFKGLLKNASTLEETGKPCTTYRRKEDKYD